MPTDTLTLLRPLKPCRCGGRGIFPPAGVPVFGAGWLLEGIMLSSTDEAITVAGFHWRCTSCGARHVAAQRIDEQANAEI